MLLNQRSGIHRPLKVLADVGPQVFKASDPLHLLSFNQEWLVHRWSLSEVCNELFGFPEVQRQIDD